MDTPTTGPRLDEPAPVVVTSAPAPADDRPVVIGAPATAVDPSRRRLLLALAVVVVLVVAGVGGWLLMRGDDGTAGTRTAGGGAAGPAVPAPLAVVVDAPAQVVAGQAATFTVHYTDGAGVFAGSTEDWGDQVGASSVQLGQCSSAPAAAPADGTFGATHTWASPGTYQVSIAAASYTCVNGAPVAEQATKTLTVVVSAAG